MNGSDGCWLMAMANKRLCWVNMSDLQLWTVEVTVASVVIGCGGCGRVVSAASVIKRALRRKCIDSYVVFQNFARSIIYRRSPEVGVEWRQLAAYLRYAWLSTENVKPPCKGVPKIIHFDV
eukprot:scaffold81933_cov51-Cyclotella_meneghiniana.AAC.3